MSICSILLFEQIADMVPIEFGDITKFEEQCKLSTQVRYKLAKDCRKMMEVLDKAIKIKQMHENNRTRLIQDRQLFKDLIDDLENKNIEMDMAQLSNRFGSLADRHGFTEDGRYFQIESIKVHSEILNLGYAIRGNQPSQRIAGSKGEGTAKFNPQTDMDILHLRNDIKILNSDNSTHLSKLYIRMVQISETPSGYTCLQLCNHGEAFSSKEKSRYQGLFHYELIADKRYGLLISNQYCNTRKQLHEYYNFGRQGPAVTEVDNNSKDSTDNVNGFVCETLPDEVLPWFERERTYGWPNAETVELFKHMGCIVVPIGHKQSPTEHLEWRLSFTNQEMYLMHNLNMTQYRCYALLKYINSDFIKGQYSDSIKSYHLKTALFYTIEHNNQDIWQPENLSYVILKCLQQLQKWVADLNCPNYFIPQENMFEAKLEDKDRLTEFFSRLYSKLYILFRLISFSYEEEKWQRVDYVAFCVHKRKSAIDNIDRIIEDELFEMPDIPSKLWCLLTRQSQLKCFIDKCCNTTADPTNTDFFPEIYVAHFFQYCNNPLIMSLLEKGCRKLIHNKPTLIASYEVQFRYIYMTLCLHLQLFVRDHDYQHIKDIAVIRLHVVDGFHIALKKATAFYTIQDQTSSLSVLKDTFPMAKTYSLCTHGGDRRGNERPFLDFIEFILNKLTCSSRNDMVNAVYKQCTMCLKFDTYEIRVEPLIYEPFRTFGLSLSPSQTHYKSYLSSVLIDPFFFASFLMYKNNEATDSKPDMSSALKHMANMVIEHLTEPVLYHFDTVLNTMGHMYVTKGWHRLAINCFRRSLNDQPLYNAVKWQVMFLLFG